MLGALIYPRPASGLFVQAAVGYSFFRGRQFDGPRETGSGPGIGAGAGYDLRVAPNFSITPMLSALYAHQGTTNVTGLAERTRVSEWAVGLTVSATWH
jgi:hypothetical protein